VLTHLETMSAYPRFFSQPFRYLRWAAIEKPAIFYSIVIGSLGPVLVVAVPPIRTRLGDPKRPEIPLTYPSTHSRCIASTAGANLYDVAVPTSPRKPLDGYDDEW
jgi:hypothetical protein